MVKTYSAMPDLGLEAPDFILPAVSGELVSLGDVPKQKPLLIMFICNHCPFVLHLIEPLVFIIKTIQDQGVYVAAINSNDINQYPEDSPDNMLLFAEKYKFSFPYLFDETHGVARDYQAKCTPDFFLFNKDRKLYYRGQFDDSRPSNNIPVSGQDIIQAVQKLNVGEQAPSIQKPSIGCNIKWKSM